MVGRALVVEDEDLVRASAADMLADLGFEVLEASSAKRAIELLERGPQVDLLVTDHLMSGMSGAELAYKVRERWPQTRTIVISGYADVEGIGLGLLRLNKPFRQSEMVKALAQLSASQEATAASEN